MGSVPDLTVISAVMAGICLSAASWLRTFLPILALGLAARIGWLDVGEQFAWLASEPVLIVVGIAALLVAGPYYVLLVDKLLDILETPTAIGGGTVIVGIAAGNAGAAVLRYCRCAGRHIGQNRAGYHCSGTWCFNCFQRWPGQSAGLDDRNRRQPVRYPHGIPDADRVRHRGHRYRAADLAAGSADPIRKNSWPVSGNRLDCSLKRKHQGFS